MDKHIVLDQDILTGSSRLVKSEKNIFDRNKFFLENMNLNKAYKYYLENFTHGNKIIGNSIYNNNLPTYPHNIFIDILYCTGVLGLSLFFFLISKILLNVRKIYNKNRLLFLIFIQLSYVSFFSGFFFVNIPLIMILALLIRFIGDSDFAIK